MPSTEHQGGDVDRPHRKQRGASIGEFGVLDFE
jgi:hypothetical protein